MPAIYKAHSNTYHNHFCESMYVYHPIMMPVIWVATFLCRYWFYHFDQYFSLNQHHCDPKTTNISTVSSINTRLPSSATCGTNWFRYMQFQERKYCVFAWKKHSASSTNIHFHKCAHIHLVCILGLNGGVI